ncbi:MAG: polysaccharide deacetylase family protein [Micromonosporaceae bacterium]|nr:polysaccharide deacetylase family protein [Micromonosporaceae bacterium]
MARDRARDRRQGSARPGRAEVWMERTGYVMGRAESLISRRRMIYTATALTIAAMAGDDALAPTSRLTRAVANPRRPTRGAPAHQAATQRPRTAPIRTLADYRRAVPGPAYPADAVALTIDDGPNPEWTPKILQLLEAHHVPATFFLIGNQVLGHEAIARSVVRAGFHVANHSWSHPSTLPTMQPGDIHKEIGWAQDKIFTTTGYLPRLFRSPGGAWSTPVYTQTASMGMLPLDWSEDPVDWKRPGTSTIVHRMMTTRPGQIMLCHDGGGDRSQTYEALRTVIPALLARGYRFVSL